LHEMHLRRAVQAAIVGITGEGRLYSTLAG
jgi:hypothetical protein